MGNIKNVLTVLLRLSIPLAAIFTVSYIAVELIFKRDGKKGHIKVGESEETLVQNNIKNIRKAG